MKQHRPSARLPTDCSDRAGVGPARSLLVVDRGARPPRPLLPRSGPRRRGSRLRAALVAVATCGAGISLVATAAPARAGTLTSPAWSASKTATGASGVTYT